MSFFRIPAALAAVAVAGFATTASAQAPVPIQGAGVFPESLSSTADGTVYIGSIALGQVYKLAPGGTEAVPFITKEAGGFAMVLGVLADEAGGNLWVCTGVFGDPNAPPTELKSFDLATGAPKMALPFPGEQGKTGVCNDAAVGPDGTVYATDTPGGRILALKPGATALTEWAHDAQFENGLDGLAFGNGGLYVNNVSQGTLFRVAVNADGSAGAVTKIETSQPLAGPDGMRSAAGGNLWVAENQAGRITHLTIDGDKATAHVIKEGLETPTAVTQVGNTVWYVEAKFAYMFGDKKGQDPGTFMVSPADAGGM